MFAERTGARAGCRGKSCGGGCLGRRKLPASGSLASARCGGSCTGGQRQATRPALQGKEALERQNSWGDRPSSQQSRELHRAPNRAQANAVYTHGRNRPALSNSSLGLVFQTVSPLQIGGRSAELSLTSVENLTEFYRDGTYNKHS